MADGTSVGKIQLDVEISQSSLNTELNKLGKVFNNDINNNFKGMFSGMANQMNNFVKSSIGKMNSSFKNFSQVGGNANKQVAQSTEEINNKMQQLVNQMESATTRAEMHRQKLLELQAQYDRLSKAGLGDSEKSKKLLEKITLAEDKINRYGAISDRTRLKIEQLEQSMSNLGDKGFRKVDDGAKKANRSFKLFGDQAEKSSRKVSGFSNTLTKSFMQVLKRVFIINLIYKAIRGLMNYMNSSLKTNKEFTNSLNQIGTNLKVAFQPIYDHILPALNALMNAVAKVTAYIAAAISTLFGKSYKQSFGAAKGIESAKKAMDGYGSSAKKAKGALAGFDEINQLDISNDEGSGGGAGEYEMEMPDTSTIDLSGLDRFKKILQPTIDSLKNLGLALEPLKSFVFQGLQDFYNNFLVPVSQWTFGEGLPRFIDAITKGLMGISWETINTSLNGLWLALTPFALNVGQGLLWFWENVLVPLGTWTMNEIVPRFLDILAEAIKVFNVTVEALKPLGLWLWDNFLKPLAEWTGGVIVSVLDGIIEALKGIGDWISDNQETTRVFFALFATWKATTFVVEMGKATAAIITNTIAASAGKFETIALIALYAKDAIAKGVSTMATVAMTIATTAWNVVAGIATGVTAAFGVAIAFLTSPIGIALIAIGSLIAIGIALYKNWDEISAWLKGLWEGIQIKATEVFGDVKDFIATTVTGISINIDKFANSFKTTWDKIWNGAKSVFSTVWNSLTGIVKGVINGIIGIVNKFINFWNKIELKVPEVTIPLVGKVGGFTIGVPKLDSIPQLARGGIVDQPTLAMVGERGKEAVIPFENSGFLEALTGSIINGLLQVLPLLSGTGNNESDDNKELVLNIEGTPLVRILLPLINNELSRLGYRTLFQTN